MKIKKQWLTSLGVSRTRADKYFPDLRAMSANYNINTPPQIWKRVAYIDVLQAAANKGEECIIVAQRRDANRPGHITAVVPEHENFAVSRKVSGELLSQLQTQAGTTNHCFFTGNAWWRRDRYHAFSFWCYE